MRNLFSLTCLDSGEELGALRGCWINGRTWTMSIIQTYLIQN